MQLLSINVGVPREVVADGKAFRTGIFKQSVPGRVRVRSTNIEGDGQADLTVHGGVDLAVYAYPHEHYETWGRELDRQDFVMGQFGENLTTNGLIEEEVRIGDVFCIGSAQFEVSQPRIPCFKLGIRMGMPEFPKLFMKSQRSGFYLRVARDGEIGAGDTIMRTATDSRQMTVRELFDVSYGGADEPAAMQRAIEMPALSGAWRKMLAERLAKT